MRKKTHKISYIRKSFARKSRVSLPFAVAALICCIASLGISAYRQGNGDVNVAAWGVSSMIFAVISLLYSVSAFLEKEMNYLLAKISLGISGVLLVIWVSVVVVGVFG